MPLNSAIASVQASRSRASGTGAGAGIQGIQVKGYAVGDVHAIEVSTDKGRTWIDADLTYKEGPWSWVVWEVVLPPFGNEGEVDLVVWSRAVGKDGERQPGVGKCPWNYRGIAYNGVGTWEGKVAL